MNKQSRSQQKDKKAQRYKRSSSWGLMERKSLVSKILADSPAKKRISRSPRYQQHAGNEPYLRINRHFDSNSSKKRQSKLLLKPIMPDSLLQKLKGSSSVLQEGSDDLPQAKETEDLEVQELFYRQVRIQQEFKKLSRMVG